MDVLQYGALGLLALVIVTMLSIAKMVTTAVIKAFERIVGNLQAIEMRLIENTNAIQESKTEIARAVIEDGEKTRTKISGFMTAVRDRMPTGSGR